METPARHGRRAFRCVDSLTCNTTGVSMTIDHSTVEKVARLARIRVTDKDVEAYAPQLDNIMQFVKQLGEVDTDQVAPLASVVDLNLSLRADQVTDGQMPDAVLANAPETLEGFFVVPKVVE
jgi:aspartyl-tRNA(Asn)/glutamyl-tRNA(Gln) amidotransferase subunit C